MNSVTQDQTMLNAALSWARAGFSVIPVNGKRAALAGWARWQHERANNEQLVRWHHAGLMGGIGVILGKVSGAVAIDLDGDEAVSTFRAAWPDLLNTYTVRSGSGHGQHLYYRPLVLPPTARAKGFELRADGCYVVAPPSPHPSGGVYEVVHRVAIMRPPHLNDVVAWIRAKLPTTSAPNSVPNQAASHSHVATDDYIQRGRIFYYNRALLGEVDRVATAPIGSRNDTLFFATRRMAGLLEVANQDVAALAAAMLSASRRAGLDDQEAMKTINSGIAHGLSRPRQIKESGR